jgi:hypothetical protein
VTSPLGAEGGLIKPSPKAHTSDGIYVVRAMLHNRLVVTVRSQARRNLSNGEIQELEELITEYEELFAMESSDCGRPDKVYHFIDTREVRPIRQSTRRLSLVKQAEVARMLEDKERHGIIEESNSPWSSPVVPVQKKSGDLRFCFDYRKMNITSKDGFR